MDTIDHLRSLKNSVEQATDLDAVKAAVSGLFDYLISDLVKEEELLYAEFPGLREAQEKQAKTF